MVIDPLLAMELANQKLCIDGRDRRRSRLTEDIAHDAADRASYAEDNVRDLSAKLLEATMEAKGATVAVAWLLSHGEALKRAFLELHAQMGGMDVAERQRLAMESVEGQARKIFANPKNQNIIAGEVRALVDRHRPMPKRP